MPSSVRLMRLLFGQALVFPFPPGPGVLSVSLTRDPCLVVMVVVVMLLRGWLQCPPSGGATGEEMARPGRRMMVINHSTGTRQVPLYRTGTGKAPSTDFLTVLDSYWKTPGRRQEPTSNPSVHPICPLGRGMVRWPEVDRPPVTGHWSRSKVMVWSQAGRQAALPGGKDISRD